MKLWKRTAAAALALALALSLAACGGSGISAFNATTYIKGLMDETYLGQFNEDYMDMVDIDETEAQETYQGGLEAEAQTFANAFNISNLTDDLMAEIVDLYKEIYAKSDYTVNPATKIDESTYAVKVEVKPLDIFHLVDADLDTYMADFYAKYSQEDVDAMTDEEYAAYDAEWAELLIALCYEKLPEMDYLDAKQLVVQVTKDPEDGYWGIPDDDFYNLDLLIIDYNY